MWSWAIAFAVAGAVSAGAGILLLLMSGGRPGKPQARQGWLLNCRLCGLLDRPLRVERFIYRHHRLFGAAIVVGASMTFMLIGADFGRIINAGLWRSAPGRQMAMIGVHALIAFCLIIGIFTAVRPSALKRFEAMVNRWVEPLPFLVSWVEPLAHRLIRVLRTPKRVGMALLMAGLFCLVAAAGMALG